jgi:hypothetical protein
MGKSAGTARTVSTSSAPGFQQPAFQKQVSEAERLYGTGGPQFFPNQMTAPFQPAEQAGQQYLAQTAPNIASFFESQYQPFLERQFAQPNAFYQKLFEPTDVLQKQAGTPQFGMDALNFAMQLPKNIGTDPTVQSAIQGATAPIFRQLTEGVLPNIRNEAIGAGGFGGTRQALAEGLATERTARNAQEVAAQIMNQAFQGAQGNALTAVGLGQQGEQQDLNTQMELARLFGGLYGGSTQAGISAASQAPNLVAGLTAPGELLGGVGAQQRSYEQSLLDEAISRFSYNQNLPYQALAEYANQIRGPFGGVAETEVQGVPQSGAAQGLGLAMAGLGLAPNVIDAIRKIWGIF